MPGGRELGRVLAMAAGIGAAALFALGAASPALADNGPHTVSVNSGSSTLTPDSCAGCHRAHTAAGQSLLAGPSSVATCLMCHGASGSGATTDVIDGISSGTTHGRKAGGFQSSIMDTGWTGSAVSRPSTSAHIYDATTTATMWGNGAIGSGPGQASVTLTCIDCHNPHGTGGWRILRPIPNGSGASTPAPIADEAAKSYIVTSTLNRYFGQKYGEQAVAPQATWEWMYQYEQWCAQCHTRYDALEPSTSYTASGDPIYKYRHMTRFAEQSPNCALCHKNVMGDVLASNPFGVTGQYTAHEGVCQNCHVAHGSSAVMGTYSGTVPWPDGSTTPSGNARSSLLRLDERGVCLGCHNPTK